MKGSVWAQTLPEKASAQREQMILDAVRRRDIPPIQWIPITTYHGDLSATFFISADALRIGDATDSVRVTASHKTAQRIADDLGAALLTPKLSDEFWKAAQVKLPPKAHPDAQKWVEGGTMANTSKMLEYHAYIDRLIHEAYEKAGGPVTVADVGKDWVNTIRLFKDPPASSIGEKSPVRSAEYGWHTTAAWPYKSETLPGVNVFQPVGLAHGIDHVDYSQTVRLVRRDVKLCDPRIGGVTGPCVTVDIATVATDPELAPLISNEGPLPDYRHPAVKPSCEEHTRCIQTGQGFVKTEPAVCQLCEDIPPPQPPPPMPPADKGKGAPPGTPPVATPPIAVAGMSGGEKLLYAGLGLAVGYSLVSLFSQSGR